LNDVKIKELKKLVPHNKLKPLRGGGSRKDNKANMSVDAKLATHESLIEE